MFSIPLVLPSGICLKRTQQFEGKLLTEKMFNYKPTLFMHSMIVSTHDKYPFWSFLTFMHICECPEEGKT